MCPKEPSCPGPTELHGEQSPITDGPRRGILKLVERLEAERPPVRDDDPAGQFDDPELGAALAVLPAADQEILRLWAWEQLEPREIALALGSTANAVSLRLSRARKKLADAMPRQDPSSPGHKGDETAEENRR